MSNNDILALILSILAPWFSTALADPAKETLKIDVEVESSAAAATELVSYFDRALSRIGDVVMTKENPDIVIHCSIKPLKLQSGSLLGYIICTAFTSSMNLRLSPLLSKLTPEQAARMIGRTSGDEIFCDMTTSVVGPSLDSVEKEIKRIVDAADGEIFQAEREQLHVTRDWPTRNAQTRDSRQH
jgi:hypothetical protein